MTIILKCLSGFTWTHLFPICDHHHQFTSSSSQKLSSLCIFGLSQPLALLGLPLRCAQTAPTSLSPPTGCLVSNVRILMCQIAPVEIFSIIMPADKLPPCITHNINNVDACSGLHLKGFVFTQRSACSANVQICRAY